MEFVSEGLEAAEKLVGVRRHHARHHPVEKAESCDGQRGRHSESIAERHEMHPNISTFGGVERVGGGGREVNAMVLGRYGTH